MQVKRLAFRQSVKLARDVCIAARSPDGGKNTVALSRQSLSDEPTKTAATARDEDDPFSRQVRPVHEQNS